MIEPSGRSSLLEGTAFFIGRKIEANMRNLLVTAVLLGSIGCGSGERPVTQAEKAQSADAAMIKSRLAEPARTGSVALSALYGIDKSLEKMGKPELVKTLNQMARSRNPEEVKKLANEIISKL